MITKITIQEALKKEKSLLIDARSPKEYEEDHIRDAINLPLLNDAERHTVGIIYKQISRDKAIEKGMEFYAPKIPAIYETVKNHQDKEIVIYCARGGMRSGIIASLLDSIGFNVFQVIDGYKGFRNYMVQEIENFQVKPKLIVLCGLTCTGKTELLHRIPNSLDLEGLAQHRGSLMGALGLKPNSQKKFENLLLKRLTELQDQEYIVTECESRRIGDNILPPFLWQALKKGININLNRSVEKRAKAMVDEYFKPAHLQEIKTIVAQFNRVISNENKNKIINHINQSQLQPAAMLILVEYYDPLYAHTLDKLNYAGEIDTNNLTRALRELEGVIAKLPS